MKMILLLGGAAAVLYYLYEQSKGTTVTGTITPIGTTPTGTTPVTTPAYNYNSLAAIAQRIQAAAGPNALFSSDGWNVYLGQQSGITPPSPDAVFGTSFNPTDRSVNGAINIPFAAYWGPMSAYLAQSLGMSGLRGWGMGGWAA